MKAISANDPPVDPKRSGMMRAVRGKDTAPELAVRDIVDGMGIRYELHPHDLPGRPDMVFRDRSRAIFVHGCFWHRHDGCRKSSIPRTRTEWWTAKLASNVERDVRNKDRLDELGWESLTIWECELSDRRTVTELVSAFISGNPLPDLPRPPIPIDRPDLLVECDAPKIDDKAPSNSSAPKRETSMPRKSAKTGSSRKAVTGSTSPVKEASAKKASPKAKVKVEAAGAAPATPAIVAANERPLPERYSASVDAAKDTVTISKGSQSVAIRMQSYASVANVLDMLEKSGGVLEAAASIELKEPFTGSTASVSTASLDDVVAALTTLAISTKQVAPQPSAPAEPPAEEAKPASKPVRAKSRKATTTSAPAPEPQEATPPAEQSEQVPEVAEAPADASAPSPATTKGKTKPSKTAKAAKSAKPPETVEKEAPPSAAAPAEPSPAVQPPKAKGKAKAPAKAAAPKVEAPEGWLDRDFQKEYAGEKFRMVRAEISIDPEHRRNALGAWKKGKGVRAEGYEVLSGDKHVAWVIAEDPKSFILTGAFDLKWSQHRALAGLLARIQVILTTRQPG